MSKSILLIEDDPMMVKFIKTVLTHRGNYDFYATEDPAEMMEIAKTKDISAIIMDVMLANSKINGQKVDGIFLTQMLKADPNTHMIPVMLCTAHNLTGDRERLILESNADGYLAKPLHDPQVLLNAITDLINYSR
jgi:CheY-like chemotaxis protein